MITMIVETHKRQFVSNLCEGHRLSVLQPLLASVASVCSTCVAVSFKDSVQAHSHFTYNVLL